MLSSCEILCQMYCWGRFSPFSRLSLDSSISFEVWLFLISWGFTYWLLALFLMWLESHLKRTLPVSKFLMYYMLYPSFIIVFCLKLKVWSIWGWFLCKVRGKYHVSFFSFMLEIFHFLTTIRWIGCFSSNLFLALSKIKRL